MTTLYLMEVEGYQLSTDTVKTLYFSTGDFTTSPTDSPANTYYEGRISGRLSFESSLFGSARLIGKPTISVGSVELSNANSDSGNLDYLDDYAFGGRKLTIYKMVSDNFAGRTVWLEGKVETVAVSYSRVEFTIRDKSFSLDQPVQNNLYLGTNSGGNGIEGDADNIKDTPKPLAYGRLQNITPVLVNYGKRIYQVHDGSIQSVDNVYDGRTNFAFQQDVANNSALQSLTVTAGNYATCLSEGLIKIGTNPQKGLTADIHGDNTGGYIDRAGSIVRRIVESQSDLSASDLNTSSFSQLDTDFNYETGVYVSSDSDINDVISDVIGPLNYWFFSRNGLMNVGVFTLASGTPVTEYSTDEITEVGSSPVNRITNNDPTNGVPVYRLGYEWGRNYTVQTRDNVYTSVTEEDVAFTSQAYRTSSVEDLTVQTKYPLSPDLTVTSLLFNQADADADKLRVLDLYKDKRFFYRLSIDSEFSSGESLNDVVSLQFNRFGLDNGKLFIVTSIRENAISSETEITLFG